MYIGPVRRNTFEQQRQEHLHRGFNFIRVFAIVTFCVLTFPISLPVLSIVFLFKLFKDCFRSGKNRVQQEPALTIDIGKLESDLKNQFVKLKRELRVYPYTNSLANVSIFLENLNSYFRHKDISTRKSIDASNSFIKRLNENSADLIFIRQLIKYLPESPEKNGIIVTLTTLANSTLHNDIDELKYILHIKKFAIKGAGVEILSKPSSVVSSIQPPVSKVSEPCVGVIEQASRGETLQNARGVIPVVEKDDDDGIKSGAGRAPSLQARH